MNAIDDAVSALSDSFQLSPLPQFDGHLAFSIEGMGRLDLEKHEDQLLVSLARDLEPGDDRLAVQRAALKLVHYKFKIVPSVQASMLKDALVLTTRLNANDADVPAIDGAIQKLHWLQEEART